MINEALDHRYDCTVNPCQTQLTAPGKVEPQPNEEDKCCIASSCRLESRPQCLESPGWEKGAIHALYTCCATTAQSRIGCSTPQPVSECAQCTIQLAKIASRGKWGICDEEDEEVGRGVIRKQLMAEKRIIDWYNWYNWFN